MRWFPVAYVFLFSVRVSLFLVHTSPYPKHSPRFGGQESLASLATALDRHSVDALGALL